MMKENEIIYCSTKEIGKRLKVVTGNKLDADQSVIYFSGIIYSIILNREVFKKNSDLKDFVYNIFLKPLHDEQYKDYLYKSRTLLGSRLSRYILENISYTLTVEISNKLIVFFDNNDKKDKKEKSIENEIANELSKWLKNE